MYRDIYIYIYIYILHTYTYACGRGTLKEAPNQKRQDKPYVDKREDAPTGTVWGFGFEVEVGSQRGRDLVLKGLMLMYLHRMCTGLSLSLSFSLSLSLSLYV